MSQSLEREFVIKHALECEENLSLALSVGDAYDDLRSRLIDLFLAELSSIVSRKVLPGWTVKGASGPFAATKKLSHAVAVCFDHQTGELQVVLAGQEGRLPKQMLFWIPKDICGLEEDEQAIVRQSVDAAVGTGTRYIDSIWCRYLSEPYSPWGSPSSILHIYRKAEWLEFFSTYLLQMTIGVDSAIRKLGLAP
ncbi:MAG: hypothetical protein K2X38_16820 [Gemmataceae bacterium]|nr:hypothetical protein [Gemmataceae bacterium]